MKKICKIINNPTSYLLQVDDQNIPFNTGYGADYFAKHYKELGYKVLLIDNYR